MSNVFFGMAHLNNNLMVAIGMDTTGPDPTRHEIVEVTVLPVSHMLDTHKELMLFNMRMPPVNLEEIDWSYCRMGRKEVAELTVTGTDKDKVAEYFLQWFRDLDMPFRKAMIPLGYNFPLQRAFLHNWLGDDIYRECFQEDYRDVLVATHFINDRHDARNMKIPYSKQDLRWIAKQLNVEHYETGGSPNTDAFTIIQCYKRLIQAFL